MTGESGPVAYIDISQKVTVLRHPDTVLSWPESHSLVRRSTVPKCLRNRNTGALVISGNQLGFSRFFAASCQSTVWASTGVAGF